MPHVTLPIPDQALTAIAQKFAPKVAVRAIHPLGNGNINDTYLVETEAAASPKFVLQRINSQVFQAPHQVMDNICHMERHVCHRLLHRHSNDRWDMPQVLRTPSGEHHIKDEQDHLWRAITFIEDATTYDRIDSPKLAYEVGVGLGTFHQLIHDLPLDPMIDTLQGFHITPHYLEQYDQVCTRNTVPEGEWEQYCQTFIRDRRSWANVLEAAKLAGKLKLQPIHGDPKVNNVMIDIHTGKAVSLVDLDTVKPGLIHYDIGDCLRSGCNRLGEETQQFENVQFDLELCQQILTGYHSAAQNFLSSHDYDHFYDCIRLLPFELGLRFFTDFVNNNQYFKTNYKTHNLHRAVVQFKLAESIESQKDSIQRLVNQLR